LEETWGKKTQYTEPFYSLRVEKKESRGVRGLALDGGVKEGKWMRTAGRGEGGGGDDPMRGKLKKEVSWGRRGLGNSINRRVMVGRKCSPSTLRYV